MERISKKMKDEGDRTWVGVFSVLCSVSGWAPPFCQKVELKWELSYELWVMNLSYGS